MLEIELYNNQNSIDLDEQWLSRWQNLAQNACQRIHAEQLTLPEGVLPHLSEAEISLVDDPTIAQIHFDFMDIEGATDVITFDHGEIILSVDTAHSQAAEYGNSFEREVLLYIIHGLLHLAGYTDAVDAERARMDAIQQHLLDALLPAEA